MKDWKKTTLGERLKYAREEVAKISQKTLAEESGASQQTISNIEKNIQTKSTDTVSLARILGVSSDWLHDGSAEMINKPYALEPWEIDALAVLGKLPVDLRSEQIRGIHSITEYIGKKQKEANGAEQ